MILRPGSLKSDAGPIFTSGIVLRSTLCLTLRSPPTAGVSKGAWLCQGLILRDALRAPQDEGKVFYRPLRLNHIDTSHRFRPAERIRSLTVTTISVGVIFSTSTGATE